MEIRLQKYMADCGVAGRRKCEEMIVSGRVSVNGKVITELGTKVSETDTVMLDNKPIKLNNKKIYIMLNKPAGHLTTVTDDRGRKTVMDLVSGEINERILRFGNLHSW